MATMEGIAQLQLKIQGNPASEGLTHDLIGVEVHDSLRLPDMFVIRLRDPQVAWTNHEMFNPGNRVTISIVESGEESKILDAEITALEPSFLPATPTSQSSDRTGSGPTLTVRGYDISHRLHRDRKTRSFVQHSPTDIVSKIGKEAGIRVRAASTRPVPYLLQTNQTDWEFLWQLATGIGFRMYVQDDTLHFERQPDNDQPLRLEWGVDLLDFRAHLSTAEQVNEVIVRGWDPRSKREVVGRATRGSTERDIGERRAGGQIASTAFGSVARLVHVDTPIYEQAVADEMAQALLDNISEAFIQAEGVAAGQAKLRAGVRVDVSGLGDRFSGQYMTTECVHRYDVKGYSTRFTVSGHRSGSLADLLQPPRQNGLGLVIGIVTNNRDPDGLGRVKVKFPWLSDSDESDWARLATPMGGNGRGILFLPEVNDEVVLGFEHGDIHRPYVLGALWNGRDALPKDTDSVLSSTGQVKERIIKTRSGHTIILSDDDADGGITIEDKSGSNRIEINSQNDSLNIEARGDVTIEAKGKLLLKGTAGVSVEAGSGSVDIKGTTINLN